MTIKGRYHDEKDTYDNRHCSSYGFDCVCPARNSSGCAASDPRHNGACDTSNTRSTCHDDGTGRIRHGCNAGSDR